MLKNSEYMVKHRVTYRKMDQDTHPSRYSPELFFEGNNIKIITTTGSDFGTITPNKGNEFYLSIPQSITNNAVNNRFTYIGANLAIVNVPYTTQQAVPSTNNINILGHTVIDDIIVIFSKGSNGVSQIWQIENNILTLKYNGVLNLEVIRDTIVRVENDNTYKIYFTDFDNYLRSFNLKDTGLIDKPVDYFDIVPNSVFVKPQLFNVNEGGNFKVGLVQYAFSLYNEGSSETTISPFSDLFILKDVTDKEISTKVITISVQFPTNLSFNNVRVYRIHYTSLDEEPTISLIYDNEINESLLKVKDDGRVSLAEYSTEELLFLGSQPFKCKTLSTHKNRIVAGNIEYENFDVTYDARAFRFTPGETFPEARIENADNDGDIVFDAPDLATVVIPEDHDCINPSNTARTNLDYRVNTGNTTLNYNRYIYKSDGVTIGGSGKNVSYTILADNWIEIPNSFTSPELNIKELLYRNPAIANSFKSYKRDEIYRFAIRFINAKGQYSFAKWIGDIRMPNQDTHPFIISSGSKLYFRPLEILFEVNNLPEDVVGYEILRVERTEADKTIVAQGVVNVMLRGPQSDEWSGSSLYSNMLQPSYLMRGIHNITSGAIVGARGFPIEKNRNLNDNNELPNYSRPTNQQYTIQSEYLQFHSPELEFKDIEFNSSVNDLMIVGGLQENVSYTWSYINNKGNLNNTFSGASHGILVALNDNTKQYRAIARRFGELSSNEIGFVKLKGGIITRTSSDGRHSFVSDAGNVEFQDSTFIVPAKNVSVIDNKHRNYLGTTLTMDIRDPSGLGIEKMIINGDNQLFNASGFKIILADLKKANPLQYGGNTYNARLNNEYIVVGSGKDTIINITNGDTFLAFHNLHRTTAFSPDTFIASSSRENIIYPVETSINLDALNNLEFSTDTRLKQIDLGLSESIYDYNPVFSQEPTLIKSNIRPRLFQNINKFTNRIIASDTKINGERIDSWLKFRFNNFLDVEGSYGPIHKLQEFNNNVFVFQPRAIARLLLQPNVALNNSEGISVQLGTGTFLYSYDYMTTNSGTENQFSVIKSLAGIYYYDTLNNKIKLLSNNDNYISDTGGMFSWLQNNVSRSEVIADNPYIGQGISTYYNPETMEVFFSFNTASTERTLCYNEMLQGFTSFYSYFSPMFIQNNREIFSINGRAIYKHDADNYGNYYGVQYSPSITLVANPEPLRSKVFDYLVFDSIYDSPDDLTNLLSQYSVWNSYQESGDINITNQNLKRRFREWRLLIPRVENSRNRFVSNYIYTKLTFNPDVYFSLSDVYFVCLPTSI